MSIWMTIKKNLPVTSDAAEYEAQRLLRSIGQLDAAIASMAGAVSARQDELEARLGRLEQRCAADGADLRSRSQELEQELGGRFVRVHRAYLAAWDKIEAADWKGNRVRVGGRECLLSRAGKAVLRQKLGGGL